MSPVRTFGFDVLLQLDEALSSRLLAARTYDLARIPGGHSALDVLSIGTPQAPSYVECGMPRLFVVPGDTTPVVHVELPFVAAAGVPTLGERTVSCEFSDVHVFPQDHAIEIGWTTIDASDVVMRATRLQTAADGLGAVAAPGDLEIAELSDTKAAIVSALRGNGPRVPYTPGELDSVVRSWTLRAFAEAPEPAGVRRCAGVSVGLYDGAPPTETLASAIPECPNADPYNFALVVAADVLAGIVETFVRERLTPSLSALVPTTSYSGALSCGDVTITPPDASGLVTVRVACSAADHGRELVVVRGAERHVATLDASGVAQLSFSAEVADPLTVSLDGLVKQVKRSTIVLRPGAKPRCTAAGIRLHLGGEVRDLDGCAPQELKLDLLLRIAIDRSHQARIAIGTPKLLDVQGEPGLQFLAWLMGEGFASVIGVDLLADLQRRVVGAMLDGFVDLGAATAQLEPSEARELSGFAMFFEELRVGEAGMTVAGHADAGIYRTSGRARVEASARTFVVAGGGVHHDLDWTTADGGTIRVGCRDPHCVVVEGAASLFRHGSYDETVQANYGLAEAELAPGQSIAFVIDGGRDLTKVLIERGVGEQADVLTFSWIAWVKRAQRGVTLRFSVEREVVRTVVLPMFTVEEQAHRGSVECETSRVTLNADTLAATAGTGYREHWFWDGHPLLPGVVHEFGGGSVVLDAAERRLRYEIDPRNGDATKMAFVHEAHVSGVDALGRAFEDTVLIPTPVFAYVRQPNGAARRWRARLLEDPRRDLDFREIREPRLRTATARARLEALVGHMETLASRRVASDGPEMNAAIVRALGIVAAVNALPPVPEHRVEREYEGAAQLERAN